MTKQIFDITTTDITFYDKLLRNKKGIDRGIEVKCSVIEMTPDEYLQEVAVQQECTIEEVYQMISERNVQNLIEVTKTEKLPLMFINKATNRQEGRHRAVISKRLGIEVIPVLLIEKA